MEEPLDMFDVHHDSMVDASLLAKTRCSSVFLLLSFPVGPTLQCPVHPDRQFYLFFYTNNSAIFYFVCGIILIVAGNGTGRGTRPRSGRRKEGNESTSPG